MRNDLFDAVVNSLDSRKGEQLGIRSDSFGKNRLVPHSRIPFSQAQQCFIGSLIGLLQHKERVQVINCTLHNLAHFSLSDVRILRFSMACRAGLSCMDFFDWSIAKSHHYQSLGLSGQSGQLVGRGHRLFHNAHIGERIWNHSSAEAATVGSLSQRESDRRFALAKCFLFVRSRRTIALSVFRCSGVAARQFGELQRASSKMLPRNRRWFAELGSSSHVLIGRCSARCNQVDLPISAGSTHERRAGASVQFRPPRLTCGIHAV